MCVCLSGITLWAQTREPVPEVKLKPRYAGTSVDAGMMFMSGIGPAFYIAPKVSFRTTPRLFLNAGVGVIRHNLLLQNKPDFSTGQTATDIFIFAEGAYLLSEKWSVSGSVMKNVAPGPFRKVNPYCLPSEAMHVGIDYKVTPNITVGARIGYSNGGRSSMYDPFYPY